MAAAIERVACIGLARMGAGCPQHPDGWIRLVVYNRTASKAEPLVRAGVPWYPSVSEGWPAAVRTMAGGENGA